MKILHIHIENFGRLKDCDITFDRGLNAVVRENGSQAPRRLSKGQRQPACTGVAHGVCGALCHGLGQRRAPSSLYASMNTVPV